METAIVGEPLADIGVTGKAPELPFPTAADVATGAVGGSVERVMCFREGTGRELRPDHYRSAPQA